MKPLSKNANIAVGAFLLVLGVVITLLSGGGVIYVGLIIVGLWRLISGLSMPGSIPADISFEEQLEREGPSRGRQVVGETCVQCAAKVFADADAKECDACAAVVHLDCMKAHRKAQHGKAKQSAA